MVNLFTAKYVRAISTRPSAFPELNQPVPFLFSSENYGDMGFSQTWQTVSRPLTLNAEPVRNDYPRYLCFLGQAAGEFNELGAQVEIGLGLDRGHMDRHNFSQATTVYIPPGLYCGPLVFSRVVRPVLLVDINCAGTYKKLGKG